MGDEEDDIGNIIVLLIILCICLSCMSSIGYKIYDLYHTYTFQEKHDIKSLNDVKDFFKEMLTRFWLWIQCNILGLFSEEYKRKCFTGAIILSQEEETRLDSAEPGGLSEALWELEADQKRQYEDYLRANYDLDLLEQAIRDGDAEAIFVSSDNVEMDEEILYWRAWITAQTSQMTHNLSNMEICGADGKVKDYMDLAATGLDKDLQPIPENRTGRTGNKTGKDFRWSNRCKNTDVISFATSTQCPEIAEGLKEKYWVDEKTNSEGIHTSQVTSDHCTGNECRDPHGIDARTDDVNAFHFGDFSGYNCKLYETLYCKDGLPDYDNYGDMFGLKYNWPELNCCACGGGSRTDVNYEGKLNSKYEFISMMPNIVNQLQSVWNGSYYVEPVNTDDNKLPILTDFPSIILEPIVQNKSSMKECIEECDSDNNCKGLLFKNCGYNPLSYPENLEELTNYLESQFASISGSPGISTIIGEYQGEEIYDIIKLYSSINPHKIKKGEFGRSYPFLYNNGT
jgi:hypothetical protein